MTLFSFPVWELVIKIVLYHWCSPMNFPKFFASYFSQNPFGWLIPLYLRRCQYKIVNIKSYKRIDRKFIYYFIFKFKHDFVTWNIKIRRYNNITKYGKMYLALKSLVFTDAFEKIYHFPLTSSNNFNNGTL